MLRKRCWIERFSLLRLAVLLVAMTTRAAVAGVADTPVTPHPSAESQALLAYLAEVYGRKTLSGQQEGWRGTNDIGFELNYLERATGKLPAILGLDLSSYTIVPTPPRTNAHEVVKHAIDWHNRNGIVALCWHWAAPIGKPVFYTKDTDFDIRRAVMEGTPENAAVIRDIDRIAEDLKLLRDAGVPVLWRPLHEANGRWFWWGAHGPEPFRKLWVLMFDRLTTYHHLNNLLWVFSPGASIDLADWYPGDEYVDIVGQDHYPMDGNNGPAKDVFDELVAFSRGTKLVGLSENGPIPDPDRMVSEKADWLFFITWSGTILTQKNTEEQLRKVYRHPHVLTLDQLPAWKKHPFAAAGTPVKLAFPAAPGSVAVDGVRRRPVTVAVQDAAGRTVRDRTFAVSIALASNSESGHLVGTLTHRTINGIATFADVSLHEPGNACVFVARADGLQSGVSAPFSVGPGEGLLREWWTDLAGVRLDDLSALSSPPAGHEILRQAIEVPFCDATNYGARFRGWLLPPMSGSYVFWIANEGVSELWLSTDATSTNKVKIAAVTEQTPYVKWPHTHEAGSMSVTLEAGKRYYLEILHRQKAGSAHLSVRWRMPNQIEERPIPANRLAPFVPETSRVAQKEL